MPDLPSWERDDQTTQVHIDWPMIAGLKTTIGSGKLDELFDLFDHSWNETTAEMRTALAGEDREILRSLAHRMKGSALNLGLTSVSEAAIAVENGVRQKVSPNTLQGMVKTLERLCRDTQAELNKRRPGKI